MSGVTTMPEMFWPLMDAPSIRLDHCAVCGRVWPLNQHHMVFRSQGKLFRDGAEVEKPTVTLCGQGNNRWGTSPDGTRVEYCHGKAHHKRLHFRNDRGHVECLETKDPVDYLTALGMDGWRDVDDEQYGEMWP